MRTAMFRWVVSVVSVVVLGGVAGAQSAEPACTLGSTNFLSYGGYQRGSAPYVVTAKTRFEQKLPNGSYIRSYVRVHQARDAAGRTMGEYAQGCERDQNGVPQRKLAVAVFDPATNVSMTWWVGPHAYKQVDLIHRRPTQEQAAVAAPEDMFVPGQSPHRETKTEDLGIRTIAGVEAHGTRTTRTIAPGDEGNDLPLVVMDEMWRSKEFGLVVLGITDDPRVGRKTFEVEELSSSEPDASVFAPPDGYKIVERNAVGNDSTKP
jgi:hypothetical protein